MRAARNKDEESNFTQLLKLRGKDQPVLLKWLERKEDKYTSHEIQNEIISIMGNNVNRNLVADIRGGLNGRCGITSASNHSMTQL